MSVKTLKWHCDVCGELIDHPRQGYVIWKVKPRGPRRPHSYKIVHQSKCDLPDHTASFSLNEFFAEEGMSLLDSLITESLVATERASSRSKIESLKEIQDLLRRLYNPNLLVGLQ